MWRKPESKDWSWGAGEAEEEPPAVQEERRAWHSGGQVMKDVTGRGNDHLC